MDWFYIALAAFTYLSLQSEAKPFLLDADYSDDDLVAEETRAFAHASSSVNGGPFASANAFGGFGGFGGYGYNYPPAPYGPFFPQPNYGYPPPFPGHQRPMRKQNNRRKNKNPHRHMQPNKPFGNNNKGPNQPPPESTQAVTIAPVPNVKPIQPEIISTATTTSLPATSSALPVKTESTSTTTEGPFYDIDVRIDN